MGVSLGRGASDEQKLKPQNRYQKGEIGRNKVFLKSVTDGFGPFVNNLDLGLPCRPRAKCKKKVDRHGYRTCKCRVFTLSGCHVICGLI